MAALVIDGFGPAIDVFRKAEIETPDPGPGEVVVHVEATSVNPADTKIRSGDAAALAPAFPAVLHFDVAGTVAAIGDEVVGFSVGDRVYGCAGGIGTPSGSVPGALADYQAADARLLAPMPQGLTFREAAALPLVALTAWEGLVWKARIQPGDHVLVHGGTGGVGHIAVQLAKALGAEVTATASTEAKRETARALGADHVVDYRSEPVEDYVARVTGGAGFDVVVDTVGGDHVPIALSAAASNGHVVLVMSGAEMASLPDLSAVYERALSVHVVFMLVPLLSGQGRERHGRALTEIARRVEAGEIRPLLDEAPDGPFGLADAAAAHHRAESGQATGKVTLAR